MPTLRGGDPGHSAPVGCGVKNQITPALALHRQGLRRGANARGGINCAHGVGAFLESGNALAVSRRSATKGRGGPFCGLKSTATVGASLREEPADAPLSH